MVEVRNPTGPHNDSQTRSYAIGRWLFLRLLGVVYLIAFASLWSQVEGLIGSQGILPVASFLDRVREITEINRYWQLPTLLWLGDSDLALHLLCGGGVALSLAVIAGLASLPALFLLWVFYLSLAHGGQAFLSFQWDTLLLETGLCALFVAPASALLRTWRPALPTGLTAPPRAGLWLLWLLIFKLMVLSGAVKPLSMDETWLQLTALNVHYWTQPLPTWISWYIHQLPAWFQKLSVLVTYVIEIALPLLIFAGHRGRRTVAAGTVFLMLVISWTGNYGFFNLLTVVLCVPLIDDAAWQHWLPAFVTRRATASATSSTRPNHRVQAVAFRAAVIRAITALVIAVLIAISALAFIRELVRTVPTDAKGTVAILKDTAERRLLSWSGPTLLRWIAPFRSINGYGLFRSMTTKRPEIVIEGSRDGTTWIAYEFKWKPGNPTRRPSFVAPHMPRLDWQMWFAALNPSRAEPWLTGLMRGILRGSPEILDLLADDPFSGDPPRFIRLVRYQFRFSTPEERHEQAVWWTRELQGPLTPAISRQQLGLK